MRSLAAVLLVGVFGVLGPVGFAVAQGSFVNWENAQVHPLERTPDGTKLLAVNTADNRLEVFDVLADGSLDAANAIAVGLDPVTVRARTDSEVWVVNHISDSISIVDLENGTVLKTIPTLDEPCDVVFAGDPVRAFVSCSQANTILVFDLDDLGAEPEAVEVFGEDPRAMAVSDDGSKVFVAIFESGNGSTILGGAGVAGDDDPNAFPPNIVSHEDGPYDGENPPPNDGDIFTPAINTENDDAPTGGMIVRKDADGSWVDGSGEDWTEFVSGENADLSGRPEGWDLPDYDLAIIDTETLELDYASGLMNICMGIAVNPTDGKVTVIGTDASNEIRFEPVIKGTFLRVLAAMVDPDDLATPETFDLNGHLDYTESVVDQSERDKSLGDPRGIVWNAAGDLAFISGKGSNNVIMLNGEGTRGGEAETIEVGEGPTGLVLDEDNDRLYVLNRFAGSISIVDTVSETEVEQVEFYDPTPLAIKVGRKHLYDTHKNSGLGQIACGSCHIDSRMDRLSWDLGDPAGETKSNEQNCIDDDILIGAGCDDFHPMKGPMLTQTLQDIIGHEPFHWRGDRDGLEEFNDAFIGLQGDDENLTAEEMQEFEDFLATIFFPPNPFRNLNNTLPEDLPLPGHYTTGRFDPAGEPLPNGDATAGMSLYRSSTLDANALECVTCHTLPTGMGRDTELDFVLIPFPPFFIGSVVDIPVGPNGEHHLAITSLDVSNGVPVKIPHLRNLYERTGFNTTQVLNTAGFGFLHDGSVDSIERFVAEPIFSMSSDQEVADMVAFMLAFAGDDLPLGSDTFPFTEPVGPQGQHSHAAVGVQITFDGTNNDDTDLLDRFEVLRDESDFNDLGVVAKGVVDGEARGYFLNLANLFQSDREDEALDWEELLDLATETTPITITAVPWGSQERIGADRDEDGFYDRDELDSCSDPADPTVIPGVGCDPQPFQRGDCNGDDRYDLADPIRLLDTLFTNGGDVACDDACDGNDDGALAVADAIFLLTHLFGDGEAPADPYSECGSDLSTDDLGCEEFSSCL